MLCNTENCHEIKNTILSTLQRTIKCLIPSRLIPAEHTFSRACISSLRKRSLVIWVWGDRVSLDFTNRRDHSKNNKSNFIGSYPIMWDLQANFFLNTSHTHTLRCAWESPQSISCVLTNISLSSCLHMAPARFFVSLSSSSVPIRRIELMGVEETTRASGPEGPGSLLCWRSTHN